MVLQAIESLGFETNGRQLALNSYENRVYQVGLEDDKPLIVKFYRPGRWSVDAIMEEHEFSLALAGKELPIVAPLRDESGKTLHNYKGFLFAIFPREGGHWPELNQPEHREWMGRFLAQIHLLGESAQFIHRPGISIKTYAEDSVQYLLENNFIPRDLLLAFQTLTDDLLIQVRRCYERAGQVKQLRIHGDCHSGNILWTDDGPHFVDFDDTRTGPAVQDLWMLLSGDRQEMSIQMSDIIEGYEMFREFDVRELHLIEPLRTMRMLNYSAWLARRWDDPAFPHNFPWFNTPRYWEDQILSLREQSARLDEPILMI
ncbi:MAG: serine/threonine protein kinase [Gammaproteobacteria bacterium]|nr:serine/threonine protein kinase [Gammaproteobacteria bacterium]